MLRVLLVAFAAYVACSPADVSGQHDPNIEGTFLFSGVSYPSLAGSFRVFQALRWEEPEAGIQLTYRADGITGAYNVYVYPASGDLQSEVAESVQAAFMFANRVRQQITVDSTRTVTIGGLQGELWILQAAAQGRVERSLLYVFMKGSSVIKYRFSYDPALRSVVDDALADLLETTLGSITSAWQ